MTRSFDGMRFARAFKKTSLLKMILREKLLNLEYNVHLNKALCCEIEKRDSELARLNR